MSTGSGSGDIQVLEAKLPDGTPCAVLFSQRTMWTLSPIFKDAAEATAFLAHIKAKFGIDDPRVIGTAPIDDAFLQFTDRRRHRRSRRQRSRSNLT